MFGHNVSVRPPRVPRVLAAVCILCVATLASSSTAQSALARVAGVQPGSTAFVGSPSSMCPAPTQSAQFNGLAVRGGRRTVALTFDDGPGRSTQAILSILESFHVRATFFNVGSGEVTWPSLVREEARDGFLIGDHTVDHKDLVQLSTSAQAAEIDGVIHEQRVLVQSSPCVFRPPYGSFNATTLSITGPRRMTLWMWNNSGGDWEARGSGSAFWVNRITSLAESEGINQQHAVVLLHNQPILMPATVAALPRIITYFLQHGYEFEDLLGRVGPPGTCASSTDSSPAVPSTSLGIGAVLGSGASLRSPGGQFVLTMQPDGNLVLRLATGRWLWSTRTQGHRGATLSVDSSGNAAITTTQSKLVWSTGTAAHRGARLALQADGDLTIVAATGTAWSSHSRLSQLLAGERLRPLWRLTSPDGLCRLVQQSTGPVTLLSADGQTLWNSGTAHLRGATTVLEGDGNLGTFTSAWAPAWQSFTSGHGQTRVVLSNAGQLSISTVGGTRLWVTP